MDEKSKQLKNHTKDSGEKLTTNQGVGINDNQNTASAGERGPSLLEDFIMREKITHFDHERVPERIVHARGSGAHGYFEAYDSCEDITKADFLKKGKKTPVFVRFSTVAGFRGSADTARDVRGFAIKFYTEEGIFDMVGNNIPVFFIQDAIKFPDLIHAVKPEPHNEVPQAASAHDNFYDFISLTPEAMHMMMWVMSDRAIPRSLSMMEGFGIHTFRFINKAGESHLVKFHLKPKLGVHGLVWDEAVKIMGNDPDFHRKDLWEAIEDGHFPEWEFGVQAIKEGEEDKLSFDVLDATKLWPEEEIPIRMLGKMVLDRNPDNFFAETEQAAFHPGHVVPGIDFTNDPLLQGRLFSYTDTQLIRLGGPNFAEIPINRPINPNHNNQRDGYMRQTINKGRVNYEPNSLADGKPAEVPEDKGGFVSYPEPMSSVKVRKRPESFKDHYTQARLFVNSMTPPEKQHIIDALSFELGKVEHKHIHAKMVDHFNHIDHDMAVAIADNIGVTPPSSSAANEDYTKTSDALSMEKNQKDTIEARKVAILVADGFDGAAVESLTKYLKSQGAKAEIIAKKLGMVKAADGSTMEVDKSLPTVDAVLYDSVFLPGGADSVNTLKKQGAILYFVNQMYKHCKGIAATGEAIEILKASDIKDVNYSNTDLKEDQGIVTAGETSDKFFKAYKDAIKKRHWSREENQDMIPA
ncbi:catalase [Fulvivirga sediminis]|uniref:Catalase n=1 Tax=Fulvivirga sediminis TaxID=2803949 RepID=A0A937JYY5_9BACT|nr:catalase [Fulvivirga sediminis]MBL3656139.1 catalase [Fulvivirga sediminis]